MSGIEGFKIKNYRTLRDITLGKLWNTQNRASLTPMTAVIGKNGVGKSTIFDAFGFLSDCLRGGLKKLAMLVEEVALNEFAPKGILEVLSLKSITKKMAMRGQSLTSWL